MNLLVLSGRVAAEPEEKETKVSGQKICRFPLAVKDTWSKKQRDDGKDAAMFVNVVLWGIQAENAMKYISKGQKITISGRLNIRHYKNKEGKTVYITECIAATTEYGEVSSRNNNHNEKTTPNNTSNNADDEEIPF